MAAIACFVYCLLLSLAFADQVPVLMWSPDRPLSDLPQAPVTGSISKEAFHDNYLTPLVDKATPVIVAFLQDKLHINDISKYADVYDPESDGGAFKNIKGHLDEHFSMELPQVENSHLALDTLRQDFPGTVHDLSTISDLPSLDLQGKGHYLVIIHLQPVADAHNEEAAIASNDEVIGKVSKHLEKQSIKYTALFTAEKSRLRNKRDTESHIGRHLLQAPDMDQDGGAFYNVSYGNGSLYAYLTSVSVCVRPAGGTSLDSCPLNFTVSNLTGSDMTVTLDANSILRLMLKVSNIKPRNSSDSYNLSLIIPFMHQKDRWEIMGSNVTIRNSSVGEVVKDFQLVTRGYDSVVPLLYSFHCSSMEWYPKNMSSPTLAFIILGGFQVQPFNVPSSGFFLSQDCVGWFSTPIWMGLFPVSINIIILLFGMYMLASLTTNDRFDDPKGKPLTINAGE